MSAANPVLADTITHRIDGCVPHEISCLASMAIISPPVWFLGKTLSQGWTPELRSLDWLQFMM